MESHRRPGQRIGSYELLRHLGSGGMGEVWEAVLHGPAGFQKVVALKLLHALPTDSDRALLVREARLGARLHHPNVVGVYGLGEVDGGWYVVMELVRGPSTAQRMQQGPLSSALLLDIGIQAAAGLAHIHGLIVDDRPAGLVHCDVKPENLLIDEHGVVKVADLGIAALLGEGRGPAGTLGFMAPEQVEGRPEPRSDLFALGVTLYVLATLRRPFERTLTGLFHLEHQLDAPDFGSPLDARVPGLTAILRRCLRSDPARRYASARELHQDLAQLRALLPVADDRPTALMTPQPEASAPTVGDLLPPSSSHRSSGNLARPPDRFVGRQAERDAIRAVILDGGRLVTLLAMGGVGKTRLALEVALSLRTEFPGGAWLLELEDARTEQDVCGAMAQQLGFPLDRTDPTAHVGRVLAAKGSALVVLDNLEQCVEAVRVQVPRWMALAPDLQILATSRTALKLRGERPFSLDALTLDDAVTLFRDRAPVPIPEAHDADLVALCEELSRVPLALELAAARLRSMSVPKMRERLGLRLLAGGSADLPDRHRSLEASIRWSWDLLPPAGREALAQLSVFVGGMSLAAVEAVLDEEAVGAGGWALDTVQELAEASLVRVESETDRVYLLPVVQAFAAANLVGARRLAVEARHAAYFAQLGAPGALERLDVPRVAVDLDNLVAAARSALARGDVVQAPQLVRAAALVLDRLGPHQLLVELVGRVLELPGLSDLDRARLALTAAPGALVTGRTEDADRWLAVAEVAAEAARSPGLVGSLRIHQAFRQRLAGRPAEAERLYDEALALLEPLGVVHEVARVHSGKGGLYHELGRDEEARRWFERSLALRRSAGDRDAEAMDLANLANVFLGLQRPEMALVHQQRALALYAEVGDQRGVAQATGDMGLTFQILGRNVEAEQHLRSALAQHRKAGNRRFEGIVTSNLGLLCAGVGRLEEAQAFLDRAIELHRASGNRRSEGIALHQLALVRERSGRLDEAETLVRRAIERHVEIRNQRWEALSSLALARILDALERPEEAAAELARANAIFDVVGGRPTA